MRLFAWISMLFIVGTNSMVAQNFTEGFFKNYTIEDGLPSNTVADITQDHRGIIWLATHNGLCSFDGYRFVTYYSNPFDSTSISGNRIINIEKAEYPYLWIGTYEGGICKFNTLTGKARRLGFGKKNKGIPDERIITLSVDKYGVTWVGCSNHFLSYILPNSTKANRFYLKHSYALAGDTMYNPEIAFVVDHPTNDSLIIISLDKYLLFTNRITGKYQRYGYTTEQGRITEGSLHFRNVIAKSDTLIWVGGWGCGLLKFNPKKNTWKQYLINTEPPLNNGKNIFYHISSNNDSIIWVASEMGLLAFNTRLETFTSYKHHAENRYSALSGAANRVFIDINEGVWAGMSNGLTNLHEENQHFKFTQLPLPQESTLKNAFYVYAVAYDSLRNQWLIGADEGDGLYIYKDGKVTITKQKDYPIFKITSIKQLSDDYFILNTYGQGVYKYNATINTIENFNFGKDGNLKDVFNIAVALDGEWIYASTWSNGIYRKNQVTGEINHWSNTDDGLNKPGYKYGFRNLFVDSKHRLWYPMSLGFGCFNSITNKFYNQFSFDNDSLYPIKFVMDITEDAKGKIWVCTYLQGILVIDPVTLKITKIFTLNDGLASSTLYKIRTDDSGDIWVTTSLGLNHINHITYEVKTYNMSTGIPDIILSAGFEIVHGKTLALGIYSGYLLADLNNLQKPIYKNTPVLTDFRVNNRQNNIEKEYRNIEYYNNNISIRYSALPYYDPLNMEYSWMLKGMSNDWSEVTSLTEVSFYKLKYGRYDFFIRYRLKGESWSKTYKLVGFTILPAWWQTVWFKLCLFLFLLFILLLVYKLRVWQIKKQENLKHDYELRISKIEMQALRSQMNPHFLFNSLNSIRLFVMKNETIKATEYLTQFSQLVRHILNTSRVDLVSLEDELNAIKLYINLEQARFEKEFTFNLKVDESLDLDSIQIPPMLLQPYIENAIWHGFMNKEGDGVLGLEIFEKNDIVVFNIIDNGIGIKKSKELKSKTALKDKSFGMEITNERVEHFNKVNSNKIKVEIVDILPTGTQVIITLTYPKL